jgi:hypothetical protein
MQMASTSSLTPIQQTVATNNAQAFSRMQDKILPETWELNRWMLASLVAVNSAACVAVYTAAGINSDTKISACWFFIYGALAALGSGFSLTFVLRKLDKVVTDAQFYWSAVSGGATRSNEKEDAFATGVKPNLFSFLPTLLLFASVGLFLLGIVKL